MAEEVVKVLKVETAGSVQTVKGLKEEINSLRDALLNCEQGSEEYKEVLTQLIDDQQKLTSVMKAGQDQASSLEGSYNSLVNEMAALKKVWRETSDEATRSEIGTRILEINDQLKEMDASIGNYQRNVGDYTNAIEQALDKSLGGISSMGGNLGKIAGQVKNLIPVIKAANKAATTGLAGVKKALISTGIGALVVAVGLLVANWDKLMKVFRKSDSDYDRLVKSNETLNQKFKEQNEAMSSQTALLQAQGASVAQIAEAKNKLIDTQLKSVKVTILETQAKIAELQAHSGFRRWITGENKEIKALNDTLKELTKTEQNLTKQRQNNLNSVAVDQAKQWKAEEDQAKAIMKRLEDNTKTEKQKLKEKYEAERALLIKHHKSTKMLEEQYQRDLTAIEEKELRKRKELQDIVNQTRLIRYRQGTMRYYDEQLAQITEKYNQLTNLRDNYNSLMEKAENETNLKTKNLYLKTAEDLIKDYGSIEALNKEIATTFIAQGDAINDRYKKMEADTQVLNDLIVSGLRPNLSKLWEELKQAQKTLKTVQNTKYVGESDEDWGARIRKAANDVTSANIAFNKAIQEFYGLQNSLSLAYNGDGGIMGRLNRARDSIVDQFRGDLISYTSSYDEGLVRNSISVFLERLDFEIDHSIGDRKESLKKNREKLFEYLGVKDVSAVTNDLIHNLLIDLKLTDFDKYSDELVEKLNLFAQAGIIPEEVIQSYLKSLMALKDSESELLQQRISNWDNLAGHLNDIFSSINDMREEDIANQVKTGKMSEDVAAKEYERLKKWKAAAAWIDTLRGALAAFMGYQELGQPWGAILGSAAAAAVLASGFAQVQQIKNSNPYDTGSAEAPSVVTPNLNDYTPDYTANLTGLEETTNLTNAISKIQPVVRVTDIEDTQNLMTARIEESTF